MVRETRLLAVALVASLVATAAVASVGPAGLAAASTPNGDDGISGSVTATVVNVTDGDTIGVRYANGSTDTVRLLGVDTPEVYAENTPEEFEGVPNDSTGAECLAGAGENASQYTKAHLAPGETVTLKFDENADHRGYYGRLLAYVYRGRDETSTTSWSGERPRRVPTTGRFNEERHLPREPPRRRHGTPGAASGTAATP